MGHWAFNPPDSSHGLRDGPSCSRTSVAPGRRNLPGSSPCTSSGSGAVGKHTTRNGDGRDFHDCDSSDHNAGDCNEPCRGQPAVITGCHQRKPGNGFARCGCAGDESLDFPPWELNCSLPVTVLHLEAVQVQISRDSAVNPNRNHSDSSETRRGHRKSLLPHSMMKVPEKE